MINNKRHFYHLKVPFIVSGQKTPQQSSVNQSIYPGSERRPTRQVNQREPTREPRQPPNPKALKRAEVIEIAHRLLKQISRHQRKGRRVRDQSHDRDGHPADGTTDGLERRIGEQSKAGGKDHSCCPRPKAFMSKKLLCSSS